MNDGHDAWMLRSDTYKSSVIEEVDGIVKLWKMIRKTSKTEFHNRLNQQFAVDFCNATYSIIFQIKILFEDFKTLNMPSSRKTIFALKKDLIMVKY